MTYNKKMCSEFSITCLSSEHLGYRLCAPPTIVCMSYPIRSPTTPPPSARIHVSLLHRLLSSQSSISSFTSRHFVLSPGSTTYVKSEIPCASNAATSSAMYCTKAYHTWFTSTIPCRFRNYPSRLNVHTSGARIWSVTKTYLAALMFLTTS